MKLHEILIDEKKPNKQDRLSVSVLKGMERRDDAYYFREYSRTKNRFVKFGVEVAGAARITIKSHPYVLFEESQNLSGLWYMKPDADGEIGFNVCGHFLIEAFDIDDVLLSQETLVVFPKTMSIDQYLLMQAEVRNLLIAFNTVPTMEDKDEERWVRRSTFPLRDFQSLLDKFKDGLEDVLEAPAETLVSRQMLMRRESVKRWTPRTLIDSQNHEGRLKIKAPVTERSHRIPEHGMVRSMLDTLHSMLRQAHDVETIHVKRLENEMKSRKTASEHIGTGTERDVQLALRNKQDEVDRLLREASSKVASLEVMKSSIRVYREEERVFDVPAEQVEETHLFIHDPRYNEVFESYERILDLAPRITFEKQRFIEKMVKSPHLFEVWTLLQLYSECLRLRFLPEESISDRLFRHFEEQKELCQVTIRFNHVVTKDSIHITYEPDIKLHDGNSRRPDYFITFINRRDTNKSRIPFMNHTLDAKYKPYSEPRFDKVLRHDLLRSCQRYLNDFSGMKFELASAALVHNDTKADTHNWNVRLGEEMPYTYSHFNISPGRTNHLNSYMKRIIHQYNGDHGYCPSCGTMNSGIPYPQNKTPYKWTYICECQEVWVDNKCNQRFEKSAHQGMNGTRLLKYAHGNYNKQVEDTWDVHCQICNRSYHGSLHVTDQLGRRLET